jgi:hypothetical protein
MTAAVNERPATFFPVEIISRMIPVCVLLRAGIDLLGRGTGAVCREDRTSG